MINRNKPVLTLSLIFLLFLFITPAFSQVDEEPIEESAPAAKEEDTKKEGGFMDTLFNALGNAANESLKTGIDEFIGTYKGRIGDVKFLERRGNSIVLEVKYEGVKRKDGVYVKGEVLKWGESLNGFNSTLSTLREKSGSVIMTISHGQDDSGWGVSADQVISDQLRLSLVRETNPERPFGELVYDFTKTWTDSSEIETPEDVKPNETDAGIELAEGEKPEQAKPGVSDIKPVKPGTIIQTGTILKPARAITVKPVESPVTSAPVKVTQVAPVKIPPIDLNKPNTMYDLYKHTNVAKWKSNAGELKFPGNSGDKQGFVLTLENGIICPNNKAVNLLETHPEWVNGGWIEGRYPLMILGNNFKFRATGAMLKGATNSDGVIMTVGVFHENKIKRIVRKKIDCNAYTKLEADLSEWAGKEIQIVLHVSSGATSAQDWAVWVNPVITNK
ncbi:MAG: hypothetical protein JW927_19205 [Deltaproteobacteria bacterium]|nr:hypothetical protein [Deltaproteobacteria bacterium]